MAGCCGSCDRGGACEGGGAACGSKGSGEAHAHAGAHPIVAKAREITGSHPAYRAPSKSSGGIADLASEYDAELYTPTNTELSALGIPREIWDIMGAADRLRLARGGAARPPSENPAAPAGAAEQDARRATLDGDEEAFQRALARVPEGDRARVLEAHLRARGTSDDAVRAGLFQLATAGLAGLTTWLNSDLRRDLALISSRSATEQERIRQEALTARAEIEAQAERYRIDHPTYQPPATPPAQSNAALYIGVGVGLLGVLAALVMTSRKGGN